MCLFRIVGLQLCHLFLFCLVWNPMERKCVECFTASSSIHSQPASTPWMEPINRPGLVVGGLSICLSSTGRDLLLLLHQKQVHFLSLIGLFIWTVQHSTIWLSLDLLTLPFQSASPLYLPTRGLSWACWIIQNSSISVINPQLFAKQYICLSKLDSDGSVGGRAERTFDCLCEFTVCAFPISLFSYQLPPTLTQNA